jgi:transcriptional regulator with XRE-family HTH domain
VSVDVGARLRYVRMRHGLSQRALAKRAGVTNSSISLIEANEVNPSVGVLKRILDGIPIGLSEFFAMEPERPRQAFYQAQELVEIGRGGISYRQVGESLFGRALQLRARHRHRPGPARP